MVTQWLRLISLEAIINVSIKHYSDDVSAADWCDESIHHS